MAIVRVVGQGTRWSGRVVGWRRIRPPFSPAAALLVTVYVALLLAATATADPIAEAPTEISGYTGRPVLFEGVGTPDPLLRIILYEWDFDGDGEYDWNSTLSGSTTHVFSEPMEATAVLRVTEYNGTAGGLVTATDTTHMRILSGRPVGKIRSSTSAEVDTDFELVADYNDPDGGAVQYFWDLNDGTTGTEQSFTHRFRELRKYNISLTVIDDEGERTESQLILTVVKELPDESGLPVVTVMLAVVVAIGLLSVAYVSFRSIRSQEAEGPSREAPAGAPGAAAAAQPVMPEASLQDAPPPRVEPVRVKPRVVSPARVAKVPVKAVGATEEVPAAPPSPPCPECATTLDEAGECPFCTANEDIDSVERRVTGMKQEGYILAEVEDRLEAAKAALHVKNYGEVGTSLTEARTAIEEAQREHDRGERLLNLVDELTEVARSRDIDTTKAANLLKLSRSFLRTGKYPKAIHYAERSRDFLLEALEPFDLDRYFCTHCKEEVAPEDESCPRCDTTLESGLIKRARKELRLLWDTLEGLPRDHASRDAIASHLEQAREHVDSRSSAAARESLDRAKSLLEGGGGGDGAATGDGDEPPTPSIEEGPLGAPPGDGGGEGGPTMGDDADPRSPP